MTKKTLLLLAGGLLLVVGGLTVGATLGFPRAFTLVREAYDSIAGWASSRGAQIRKAFGVKVDALKPEGTVSPVGVSTGDWNRRKLATLAPAYRARFENFLAAARRVAGSAGVDLMIWEAARSLERQVALYQRGRSDDGTVVTYTVGGSRHVYGLAVDLYPRGSNGYPVFDHPSWWAKDILPLATRYGLSSLFLTRGIDKPHVEVADGDLPASVRAAMAQIEADRAGVV